MHKTWSQKNTMWYYVSFYPVKIMYIINIIIWFCLLLTANNRQCQWNQIILHFQNFLLSHCSHGHTMVLVLYDILLTNINNDAIIITVIQLSHFRQTIAYRNFHWIALLLVQLFDCS